MVHQSVYMYIVNPVVTIVKQSVWINEVSLYYK